MCDQMFFNSFSLSFLGIFCVFMAPICCFSFRPPSGNKCFKLAQATQSHVMWNLFLSVTIYCLFICFINMNYRTPTQKNVLCGDLASLSLSSCTAVKTASMQRCSIWENTCYRLLAVCLIFMNERETFVSVFHKYDMFKRIG